MHKGTSQRHAGVAIHLITVCLCLPGLAHAQASLGDIVGNAVTCTLIEPLMADMSPAALHALDDAGACVEAVPSQAAATYYEDPACQRELSFVPSSTEQYCDALLDAGTLGEGQNIIEDSWTLSPGSRLDVGARSLEGVSWPYLQRRVYRTVNTAGGSCSLEMRIYAPEPGESAEERPSMLAFHGGSWSARGFGFFGLEMSIPHYVDRGFVVYAPFYRLLGDKEGSAACHQSDIGAIVDDATAALAWVREHASEYGSSEIPVVFGQSAGAHLATSLAVNEPESVSGAILMYPPTDFTDFVVRAQQGYYTDEQGLDIIGRVLGTDAAQADVSASPIPENSFPQRIVESSLSVPPVFMIHGLQDTLVEARQSVRLCQALAGEELLDTGVDVSTPAGLRSVRACGSASEVHLVTEGQHALDVCVVGTLFPSDLCLSGSDESRAEVSLAIGEAVDFAVASADVSEGGTNVDPGGDEPQAGRSSSGAADWLWLLSAVWLLIVRRGAVGGRQWLTSSSRSSKR